MIEYPEDIPPFDMLEMHKVPEIEIIRSERPEICFLSNVNRICFGGLSEIDLEAEEVLLLLNHELFHWAQDLLLTFEEIFEHYAVVQDIPTVERFTERTNPYKDYNIDLKIWRGYYGRRKDLY
jgi:hypothetical protein